MPFHAARAGILIALALLVFAAILAWQITLIPHEGGYAQIGPAVVPWLLAAMFALLGAAALAQALRGTWQIPPAPGSRDRSALAWVAAGLLLNLLLIEQVGFILASTLLFLCTARAFGSASPIRDAALGFTLALACYAGFDRLLGYQIGDGLIENLL